MRDDSPGWKNLQKKLVKLVGEYLVAQVKAGASAVQISDSWVGRLSPSEFREYVLPYLIEITAYIKSKTDAPIVYFGTNTFNHSLIFERLVPML